MPTRWIVLGAIISISVLGAAGGRELARVGVHQGYTPVQPIEFSHQIHAGREKVPCLYCHFGATRSRHAGIPPANVCMNCHSLLAKETVELRKLKDALELRRPIAWVKVHNLPDFVYFNHSQHVLASVACQECHGPIETMARVRQEAPLTMGWCIGCHRQRGVGAVPAPPNVEKAALKRPKAIEGIDCGKCHY